MKLYDAALETFARSRVGSWMFVNVFNHVDRFLLAKTNGRVSVGLGSRVNKDVVLLGCTGARSGLKREVPLLSTPVGDEFVLIASTGGAPKHPAWYSNLKANPDCTLTTGGDQLGCAAQRRAIQRAGRDTHHGDSLRAAVYSAARVSADRCTYFPVVSGLACPIKSRSTSRSIPAAANSVP